TTDGSFSLLPNLLFCIESPLKTMGRKQRSPAFAGLPKGGLLAARAFFFRFIRHGRALVGLRRCRGHRRSIDFRLRCVGSKRVGIGHRMTFHVQPKEISRQENSSSTLSSLN